MEIRTPDSSSSPNGLGHQPHPGATLTSLADAWKFDLSRGLKQLERGNFDRAEVYFSRAHRRSPEQPETCFALGRERLRNGQLHDAELLLRKAWRLAPDFTAAAAGLARCLGAIEDRRQEAHSIIDEAMNDAPEEPGLLIVRAEILLEQGELDKSRDTLDTALGRLPTDRHNGTRRAALAVMARTFNYEGIDLGRQGHSDQALFAFKRAADLDPHWSGPMVNMGIAFAQMGRHARARSCYEQALTQDPENSVALFNMATLSVERGDLIRAESELRQVLEMDPEYPGARTALANVLLEQRQPNLAAECLNVQLDLAPEDPEVWHLLGVAFEMRDQSKEAERYFRRALSLDSEFVAATCHLANVLHKNGEIIEAAKLARRAREQDPELAEAFFPTLN